MDRKEFFTPVDFLMLKPTGLKTPFTNMELAQSLKKSVHFARKMSYCLRKMGLFKVVGKKSNAFIFDY